jgi:hypothetical protein
VSNNDGNRLLPGQELVDRGMADLAENRLSDYSLLVLIAGPRLKRLGIQIPTTAVPHPFEHQLYARLDERLGAGAHSYYNSLIRRIVSYARALEREKSQP